MFTKIEGNAHAQSIICSWATFLTNAHAQTIICTQLFAGKLTNQNWEYYKVNDNSSYLSSRENKMHGGWKIWMFCESKNSILLRFYKFKTNKDKIKTRRTVKYYRKSACKTNKRAHIKIKTIYLGQVIKILIVVNKNLKYDIYLIRISSFRQGVECL